MAESALMTLTLHAADDLRRLQELMSGQANAKQRDRYRAVLLVATEQLEGDQIARRLGRSARFVDEWVARYRMGGIDALVPRKQPGRRPKLTPHQRRAAMKRLAAGEGTREIAADFNVQHSTIARLA